MSAAMTGHVPVLLNEVVDALQPRDGGRYVDGTFGGGGYTSAILDRAAVRGDRDRPRSRCHCRRQGAGSSAMRRACA